MFGQLLQRSLTETQKRKNAETQKAWGMGGVEGAGAGAAWVRLLSRGPGTGVSPLVTGPARGVGAGVLHL